jgi:hypothetical protein
MATVGEKRNKVAQALKKVKLTEPSTYWRYLEEEGKKCLRDI